MHTYTHMVLLTDRDDWQLWQQQYNVTRDKCTQQIHNWVKNATVYDCADHWCYRLSLRIQIAQSSKQHAMMTSLHWITMHIMHKVCLTVITSNINTSWSSNACRVEVLIGAMKWIKLRKREYRPSGNINLSIWVRYTRTPSTRWSRIFSYNRNCTLITPRPTPK